jgi:hypothetical protein
MLITRTFVDGSSGWAVNVKMDGLGAGDSSQASTPAFLTVTLQKIRSPHRHIKPYYALIDSIRCEALHMSPLRKMIATIDGSMVH